ncbi:sensor histidine kinase (plasmid) [Ensifer adhaerens]|uniref:sensor histidine kinase n=1 Tax=Ensifer adhaerens TaxID=106592 RepID=UPI0023A9C0F4|nr:sensor histidine kinase [Ensifer adhaerens]WDZ81329.1 sensor histidine kinase [Ensifer adhaerens]
MVAPYEPAADPRDLVRVNKLITRWNSQSLARQFLLIGGLVAACAMVLVGAFVSNRIEDAVTRNSAATTALYVDSVIAPLLPDMQKNEVLDETVARALDETLGQGALGVRLLSFRLWRSDGTLLYSSDRATVGTKVELSGELQTAFSGKMAARFDEQGDVATDEGRSVPTLAIYNPVLQPWSGQVVAVSEFHEVANDFQQSLNQARMHTWLAVAAFTLAFFVVLSAIVLRGSKTIESQRHALKQRVDELSASLTQNETLRGRLQRASQRATALNESYLRRISADLHDGPAQLVAYASLRLDSETLKRATTPASTREREIGTIKASLDEAMQEIRTICGGLVLPQIETADLADILRRCVKAHQQRTGCPVELRLTKPPERLSQAAKICIYRFVQETLNNGFRHAGGVGQRVSQWMDGDRVTIEVVDSGPGFDPDTVLPTSLGLAGLRERIESLGGTFELRAAATGTTVRMTTSVKEI